MNSQEQNRPNKALNILIIGVVPGLMIWGIIASLLMSLFSTAAAEIAFGVAGGVVGWRLKSSLADE